MNFRDRLKTPRPIIVDGAMGTLLFQKIPGYAGSFELLNVEQPKLLEEIHELYFEAGTDIVETNTFGGSSIKLEEFNLAQRCEEINEAGAALARRVADRYGKYVGGSVGPTGTLIEPMGETPPEVIYEAYAAQMRGLERGGADAIIIETMNDIQEAKLALLAAKDQTKLPVICSMTFEENGKTMTGTDMLTGFATLSALGADVVGANCSMGPDGMVTIWKESIDAIRELGINFSVWSNAGLPEMVDGEAVYSLTPDRFAELSLEFANLGVRVIGGCCGTTPEHIRALGNKLKEVNLPPAPAEKSYRFLTSRSKTTDMGGRSELIVLGERLNPSARKKFAADLKEEKQDFLREESRKQVKEGAHVLDINVGLPGIDEIGAMHRSIATLSNTVDVPLMIDSDNPQVLEKALMTFPGIPIVNSINGKQKSIDTVLPLIKRFGCYVVALCLDDSGIHQDAEKRIAAGDRLVGILEAEGIHHDRILVDPLMLAESAEPGAAMETLKVVKHFSNKGIKTSLGISNISFGLPQRKHINNMFLSMAVKEGLSAAIVNPTTLAFIDEPTDEEKLARDFLTGADHDAVNYIAHFKDQAPVTAVEKTSGPVDIIDEIFTMVVEGNVDAIEAAIEAALPDKTPQEIMDNGLLKALEKVGELYSTGEYFLPQMIASANTMKKGFLRLKPLLAEGGGERLGTVVICTVKGDIHDIGKNIVAMMMENHGFEVHDLGKDVAAEEIIKTAKEVKGDIICLSSLLTTTMGEMKRVTEILESEKIDIPVMVGGAVVNQEYADSIRAHYSKDAVEAVNLAKTFMKV